MRTLPGAIRCPTLVPSRHGNPVGPPDAARHMAELIPGTRFVELEGDDQVMWLGDLEALCGEIGHFITGVRPLGVRLRAGVHIGEVLERNGALRGIAVHVAARVMGEAAGCEVLVHGQGHRGRIGPPLRRPRPP